MIRRLAPLTALVTLPILAQLAASACSPAVTPHPTLVATASAPPPKVDGPDAPSRWTLSPWARWEANATLVTDRGKLVVGDGGERWLRGDQSSEASPHLLPGKILGVAKDATGYTFLLADGSVFTASDPLGPATRRGEPRRNLKDAALGKDSVLVVDDEGVLSRSADHGKTWSKVSLGAPEGFVRGVSMSGAMGIAIAVPQRLYLTRDDGATWTPLPSPGDDGVEDTTVVDGELRALASGTQWAIDPASLAWKRVPAPPRPPSSSDDPEVIRAVFGKRTVAISGKPSSATREWAMAAGELGSMPAPHPLAELNGCDEIGAAVRGEVIEIACDARGTVEGGVDTTSTPFDKPWTTRRRYGKQLSDPPKPSASITKLLRSEDGGKTFKEDGVLERGGGVAAGADSLALGDGGWLFLAERCSGEGACRPPQIRASAGAPFHEVPGADRFLRFAGNGKSTAVFALGVHDSAVDGSTHAALFRFGASETPELIGDLARAPSAEGMTLSLDDEGALHGFYRASDAAHLFAMTPGQEARELPLPVAGTRAAAMNGKRGFAIGDEAFETLDEGKTWLPVQRPELTFSVASCTTYGCATNRGFRVGWDGVATGTVSSDEPKPVFAKSLRCAAQGAWTTLGGGSLGAVEHVDVGSSRWALPTRDLQGRVTLHVNKRGDAVTKLTDVPMMGPAPQPPKFGAETVMFVQSRGVVVRRFSYSKERRIPGVYNPVDATLAWYRGDGKVARASVPKIPAFRVQHDPRFDYEDAVAFPGVGSEMTTLEASGVRFTPPSYEDPHFMYLLRDDGRVEKQKAGEQLGDTTTLAQAGGDSVVVNERSDGVAAWWIQRDKTITWHASHATSQFLDLGGKASVLLTLESTLAPRAWAVTLKPETDPSEWVALPTQKTFGDTPRACDGPPATDGTGFRYFAPYFNGTRRAVTVDLDGVKVTLASDRAAVRGSSNAPSEACVSALEATEPDARDTAHSALVFPDDLAHSLVFEVDRSASWPETVRVRSMECAYASESLPASLSDTPGFRTGTVKAQSGSRPPSRGLNDRF